MSKQEIISKWKSNEKPFGLLPKDMKYWAECIGGHNFIEFCSNGQWSDKPTKDVLGIFKGITYRLRPDYPEEPEVIECEIAPNTLGILVVHACIEDSQWWPNYIESPSFTKIDGQKVNWLKMRFSNGDEIRALYHEDTNVKPVAAIFEVIA